MLGNLENEPGLAVLHLERVEDGRQLSVKLHIHHGADDGRDLTGRASGGGRGGGGGGIVRPAWKAGEGSDGGRQVEETGQMRLV